MKTKIEIKRDTIGYYIGIIGIMIITNYLELGLWIGIGLVLIWAGFYFIATKIE